MYTKCTYITHVIIRIQREQKTVIIVFCNKNILGKYYKLLSF